ncbi:MAG: Cell division protein FtsQ [Pseudomonadota bacterium]
MKKPMTLPMDVRLMQWTASLMFVLAFIMCVASGIGWLLRHPAFSIQGITVRGNVTHSNTVTLRANVPWIRSALVRREFPNRLNVTLEEFFPVAQWATEGDGKFLSKEGTVFEVSADDVDPESLPLLVGPDSQAPFVLEMYKFLKPKFDPMDMTIDKLELSQRGSWTLQLDSGAVIELGQGTQQEISDRLQVFFKTLTQVASRYSRTATSLLSADLRYENGYALRLRGVSTLAVDGLKKP